MSSVEVSKVSAGSISGARRIANRIIFSWYSDISFNNYEMNAVNGSAIFAISYFS